MHIHARFSCVQISLTLPEFCGEMIDHLFHPNHKPWQPSSSPSAHVIVCGDCEWRKAICAQLWMGEGGLVKQGWGTGVDDCLSCVVYVNMCPVAMGHFTKNHNKWPINDGVMDLAIWVMIRIISSEWAKCTFRWTRIRVIDNYSVDFAHTTLIGLYPTYFGDICYMQSHTRYQSVWRLRIHHYGWLICYRS